ncbi:uncharacterized protein LOC144762062 isoform X1 [Lissotriton helveticus]
MTSCSALPSERLACGSTPHCRTTWPAPLQTQRVTEKPGICPDLLFDCPKFEANECVQDGECEGMYKCCLFRCRFMCAEPILEKIGSCPLDTSTCTTKEPDECQTDSDCLTNKRCCLYECGLKCRSPLPGKIGHCPKQTTLCEMDEKIPAEKCVNDLECPGQQKCCNPGCGVECTDPATDEKDGLCPYEEEPCLKPEGEDMCESDEDCPGLDKCCGSCQKMCTTSVQDTDPETAFII